MDLLVMKMLIQSCNWLVWLGFILIATLTFVAYRDIVNHEFLYWDDYDYILSVPHLRTLSFESLTWMFTNSHMSNWHPITWMSLSVNFVLGGENPLPFKITNLIIHIFNACLLGLITVKLLNSTYKISKSPNVATFIRQERFLYLSAIITTGLFALAPQHVESVIWVSDRKDLLCGSFFLMTIYTYISLHTKNREKTWNFLPFTCFCLALMSKSMAVTLPIILVLLDFYPLNRRQNHKSIYGNIVQFTREKWAYVLVCFSVALITIVTQNSEIQDVEEFGILARIVNSSSSIVHYLWTVISPIGLSAYYPRPESITDFTLANYFSVAIVVCIFYACGYYWKKGIRFPLVVWLFTLITLLPVLDIIKVGNAAAADRYNYIPTMGAFILLGFAIAYAYTKLNGLFKVLPIVSFAILLTNSFVFTSNNSQHWRTDYTLWESVLKINELAIGHNNLASLYFNAGNHEQAKKHLDKALTIEPGNSQTLTNMSAYYEQRKQIESAEHYMVALTQHNPTDVDSLVTAGDFYIRNGIVKQARPLYRTALRLAPTSPAVIAKNARLAIIDGKLDNARELLNISDKLDKDDLTTMQVRLLLFLREKQNSNAISQAKKILRSYTDDKLSKDVLEQLNAK